MDVFINEEEIDGLVLIMKPNREYRRRRGRKRNIKNTMKAQSLVQKVIETVHTIKQRQNEYMRRLVSIFCIFFTSFKC